MNNLKTFYRNRLPHFTPVGGTFFVTFRIKDALPLAMMQALRMDYQRALELPSGKELSPRQRQRYVAKARYDYFMAYDARLDARIGDACYLKHPEAATLLADRLHHFDEKLYELKAYCIMPNHAHILISLANQTVDDSNFLLKETELQSRYVPLCEVMRLVKGGSSRVINQYLGRSGTLWQPDSYDHYVRNARSFNNILRYILENPVKARLVSRYEQYRFNYYA